MKKKYIFLDIDGTLVHSGVLPDSALEALQRARERGHELVLCTGRSMYEIFPFLFEVFDFDGIISSSGSEVLRGEHKIVHEIGTDNAKEMCSYFAEHGIPHTVMTSEMTYRSFADYSHNGGVIEQIDIYCSAEEAKAVRERFGENFNLVFGGRGETLPGEITPRGISKASGIREYIELCGGDVADTIAFGDSGNDKAMLSFAGIGVAMGNAEESVKAIADVVTDRVDRDGLYKAFLSLGLI